MAANDDDYWTQDPSTVPTHSQPVLQIEEVEGVEPLNDRFGVDAPMTVPHALHEAMFGQSGLSETGIEGELVKVPPLQTYAILDAARVPNLPERLEASGLDHRCLFQGKAYDEMKDVAPWVVQLKEGNAFTRNLFVDGDAAWHL